MSQQEYSFYHQNNLLQIKCVGFRNKFLLQYSQSFKLPLEVGASPPRKQLWEVLLNTREWGGSPRKAAQVVKWNSKPFDI